MGQRWKREIMGARATGEIRLIHLSELNNIEAYLITSERLMRVHGVSETHWAFRLAPQLTDKAQQAYAALPVSEASDYNKMKAAILRYYDINEETYTQKFRSTLTKANESYSELVVRLQHRHEKWTRGCTTMADMREVAVMEQFLNTLPMSLRLWVRERSLKTVAEAE